MPEIVGENCKKVPSPNGIPTHTTKLDALTNWAIEPLVKNGWKSDENYRSLLCFFICPVMAISGPIN